jgi:GTP-binding protein
MPLPRIAIVGRPNVGKSSLLNRLAKQRVSIVDPTPGVTRDRVSAVIEIDPPLETPRGTEGRMVEVIDTGGYGVYTAQGKRYDDVGEDLARLTADIEAQIMSAVEEAQIILFVIDAQDGLTSLDETIARLLRERGAAERVICVANKVDEESWVPAAMEASGLGLGEPMCVSTTSGYGIRKLLDLLHQSVSPAGDVEPAETEMKLAIVGRRNTGKSTLVNALAGQERVIVSDIAGTTRDSIDVRVEMDGRALTVIDTAGLRKRKSFADDVEYYAYHRMLGAIRRDDVALLIIDASQEVSQVDQKLAQELQRQGKPTVIVVNKWDLAEAKRMQPGDYQQYLTERLRGLDFAPLVFMSAARGEGLREAVAMAFNLHEQAGHRETTGRLNDLVRRILEKRGPSSKLGTKAKVYYVSQIATRPPTIAMVVNDPKLFEGQYERYMMNELREALPYSEVPIRLALKARKRTPLEVLKGETIDD